jgi:hypothetical protein
MIIPVIGAAGAIAAMNAGTRGGNITHISAADGLGLTMAFVLIVIIPVCLLSFCLWRQDKEMGKWREDMKKQFGGGW